MDNATIDKANRIYLDLFGDAMDIAPDIYNMLLENVEENNLVFDLEEEQLISLGQRDCLLAALT